MSEHNTEKQAHWEQVYQTKKAHEVSWYRPHLEQSLQFIQRAATSPDVSVIDIGGGESTLVDDLLTTGYRDVTVLDIASEAIAVAQQRLVKNDHYVTWLTADITQTKLDEARYDIWHDRAVFHFLTTPEQRAAYMRQLRHTLKSEGHVVIATFGPQGPLKCSGLEIVRYDVDSLMAEFGQSFRLIDTVTELHQTPFQTTQQFLYCFFQRA